MFTDCSKKEVTEWFDSYSIEEYARAGFRTTTSVKLEEGPLKQFSHSIEPYLRQLGLPTKLERGVVTLIKKYEVCKKGSILTPEQAKILQLLDYKLATFKLKLIACWTKGEGFERLSGEEEEETNNDEKEKDTDEEMEEA